MTTSITLNSIQETLYDLIGAVQSGFARMDGKFEIHDRRFDTIDATLQEMRNEITQKGKRINHLELQDEIVQDSLLAHDERITRLERHPKLRTA